MLRKFVLLFLFFLVTNHCFGANIFDDLKGVDIFEDLPTERSQSTTPKLENTLKIFQEDFEEDPIFDGGIFSSDGLLSLKQLKGQILILYFYLPFNNDSITELKKLDAFHGVLVKKELEDKVKIIPVALKGNLNDSEKELALENLRVVFASNNIKNLEPHLDIAEGYQKYLDFNFSSQVIFIDQNSRKMAKNLDFSHWYPENSDKDPLLPFLKKYLK